VYRQSGARSLAALVQGADPKGPNPLTIEVLRAAGIDVLQ
jgi:hypothetical protein